MKRFRIADDALSVAGDVGYVQEVVTGNVIEEEEETLGGGAITADVLDEEGDIFGEDEDLLGDFSLDPAEEERIAQQKAEEERTRQEEQRSKKRWKNKPAVLQWRLRQNVWQMKRWLKTLARMTLILTLHPRQ